MPTDPSLLKKLRAPYPLVALDLAPPLDKPPDDAGGLGRALAHARAQAREDWPYFVRTWRLAVSLFRNQKAIVFRRFRIMTGKLFEPATWEWKMVLDAHDGKAQLRDKSWIGLSAILDWSFEIPPLESEGGYLSAVLKKHKQAGK